MPYISSSGKVYTIDGPRQRRVQLEKPILLAVAMLLCVFVLARQGTAALASAVHVNRGVPAAQLAQDARLDSERRRTSRTMPIFLVSWWPTTVQNGRKKFASMNSN